MLANLGDAGDMDEDSPAPGGGGGCNLAPDPEGMSKA
jgi:hypothetical protein